MFETVVVGADGSDTAAEAVRVATELVKLSDGNLHIVTAYKPQQLRSEAGGEFAESLTSDDLAQSVLADLASRARTAGIAVETGLMRETARELNRGFLSRIERGRPWVRVKLAMSLDGRTALANGKSQWITAAAARADVQRCRARSSAILTGARTARVDDPRLTVRLPDGEAFTPALRVVLDARLDALPAQAHLLDGSAPTLILHGESARPRDKRYRHAELVAIAADARGRIDLAAALDLLAARGINELQVEAGPVLCGALVQSGLVDELLLYVSPILLGDTARPLLNLPSLAEIAAGRRLRVVDERRIGEDWRLLLRE